MDSPVYRNGSDYMYHNTTIPMVELGDILVILGHRNTQIYK